MKLQVEAYGLVRFVTTTSSNNNTIKDLQQQLEQEVFELYTWKVKINWVKGILSQFLNLKLRKDEFQNDLNPKHKVGEVLKEMDQIFVFITFEPERLQ